MTDCLFCRIVAGEIPADVVRDAPDALAFRDINPQAPVHVVVIPKEHYANVAELTAAGPDALHAVLELAGQVAMHEGVAATGWRLVFNTGVHGGQSVEHVHGHVLGGRQHGWPAG